MAFLNAMVALATLDVHINGRPIELVRYDTVEGKSRYMMLCTFVSPDGRYYKVSLELSTSARSAPYPTGSSLTGM